MAAITATTEKLPQNTNGRHITRTYGTGTANQADTLTSAGDNGVRRLLYVTTAYSAAPTQAGVVVSIDSGLGAGYDATLSTGSANAQYSVYLPDGEVWLFANDEILVSAPAGGSGITAAIVIVTEGK